MWPCLTIIDHLSNNNMHLDHHGPYQVRYEYPVLKTEIYGHGYDMVKKCLTYYDIHINTKFMVSYGIFHNHPTANLKKIDVVAPSDIAGSTHLFEVFTTQNSQYFRYFWFWDSHFF